MAITEKDVIGIADEYLVSLFENSGEDTEIPFGLIHMAINEKLEIAMPQILGMVESTEASLKAGKILDSHDVLLAYVIGYVTAWAEAMLQSLPTQSRNN